jgi:hypothetical protein
VTCALNHFDFDGFRMAAAAVPGPCKHSCRTSPSWELINELKNNLKVNTSGTQYPHQTSGSHNDSGKHPPEPKSSRTSPSFLHA